MCLFEVRHIGLVSFCRVKILQNIVHDMKVNFPSILISKNIFLLKTPTHTRGRRGRDRMVVGCITSNTISAYHHRCCEFNLDQGEVCNIV